MCDLRVKLLKETSKDIDKEIGLRDINCEWEIKEVSNCKAIS